MAEAVAEKETLYTVDWSPVLETIHQDNASLAETVAKGFAESRKVLKGEVITDPEAGLDESIVSKVKSSTNMVIPVAVGGFGAIVISELVDGLMISQTKVTKGLVKAGGAFAVYTWGKKIPFMGTTGKNVAAALLLFDALRDLTPISEWASTVANKVSRVVPTGGLGDQRGRDVITQARVVTAGKGVGI